MQNELKQMVGNNETIYYEGKPDKKCFIFESVFNKLLPVAIIWAILDFSIIGGSFSANMSGMSFFMIPFFIFHLMPVWIYLAGAISSFIRYRNTYYIVTDRAIYVSGGVFSKTYKTKSFAEMSHIDLHRGVFDQLFNVGDVIATSSQVSANERTASVELSSISDFSRVFGLVKKLQTDVYSDIMYPNDMRPPENHGYNTKYKG